MNYQHYADLVKKMNPIDDDFFRKMSEDAAFCTETLRTILGDEGVTIEKLWSQHSIKNLQGRSVVLDVHCQSVQLGHGLVEVQKTEGDDHQKRVRYNGACVTTNITDTGVKFEQVPNICSIYITKKDFLKGNRAIYHVERRIRENGKVVENGFREIYVNTQVKDGSPVSELMTLYTEDDAYDFHKFPATSKRKYYLKNDEKGVAEMCEIMQNIKEQGRAEGKSEGLKALIETCRELCQSYEATKKRIMEKFSYSSAEAESLLQKYW